MTDLMPAEKSITHLLHSLWQHITPRRRGQFGLLLVLMLLASFAEILSIGAVLPFLGVLTAPERRRPTHNPGIGANRARATLVAAHHHVWGVGDYCRRHALITALGYYAAILRDGSRPQHKHLPPHAVSALHSALRPQQQRDNQRHLGQSKRCYLQHHLAGSNAYYFQHHAHRHTHRSVGG